MILKCIDKPGKALDLGSSNGFLVSPLEKKGVECTCVDILPRENISDDIKNYHQINIEDYSKLNFKREYDYIIMADIIEHVINSEGLTKKTQKFLKKDGKIIISVPNIAIWIYRFSLLIGRFNYGEKGILDETHVKHYTCRTIIQLLERCGFIITKVYGTSLPFEVIFESTGKSYILKLIDNVYFFFVKLWPEMFAYQIVVEAVISSYDYAKGEGEV